MPRLTLVQTNFSAGEWSPVMLGRTDLPNYQNAAEALENVVVLLQGGATRRPGLRYVASAKNALKRARVIPFVFSSKEAYILEVGDLYVRFYKNGAQLGPAYEVASPFTEAMLPDMDFVQSADTMIMAHASVPTQRLRRFGDTNWALDAIPFAVLPFDEIGHSFSVGLTLSAATVGAGRTATSAGPIFQNADVGRDITYQGGLLTITGFTSASIVTGDIKSAFPSVNIPTDLWTLTQSPKETITPSAKDPLEAIITLTATALSTWRAADVGKFVRLNDGLVRITAYTSPTVVSAAIKSVLTTAVAVPANAWTLEASVWSAQNGYPQAATISQQRLILGGTPAYPQTVWGSTTGAYLDFTLGVRDSDAFAYTLASDQINPIMHFASSKILVALTYGGEFTLQGGVEKPITPTNVQAKNQTAYGALNIRPVRVGKDVFFIDNSAQQLLGFAYDINSDDYDADDHTLFADHIAGPGFVDLSYQRRPTPIIWAPRSDGILASATISRQQSVVSWARQTTDGLIESVATIPMPGGYQTWALVQRTVNGATVRYVERFDPTVLSDSALTDTSIGGQAIWPAAHLTGKAVDVVADGRYLGRLPVVAGNVTLPRNANSVMYGLPYTSRIKLLTPETQTGEGSAQGNAMSTHEVVIRFLNTYACKANGHEVAFRKFGSQLLDQPLQGFTGLKRLENLGWENGKSDVELTSDLPLAFTVLAAIRKFTVNTG